MERKLIDSRQRADPDASPVLAELIHGNPLHRVRGIRGRIAVAQASHSARIDQRTLETIRGVEI